MNTQPFPETVPAARILASILAAGRCPLGPGASGDGQVRAELGTLQDAELLGVPALTDAEAASAVRSGLLLLTDEIDASHTISQSIHTPDGSFWHGIMHRREPDYPNSKYWFRHVGNHPVYQELATTIDQAGPAASEITASGSWDPFAMVDAVEACERGRRSEWREELEALQELEALALLAHCYTQAVG